MSTDRELLEAAAKAAGKVVEWHDGVSFVNDEVWLPFDDTGDAFKLGVASGCLRIDDFGVALTTTATEAAYAEWRRAVVQAAAAIGAPNV